MIIGHAEYVDLPEWGIEKLRAKVDTGARSSALHVEDIQQLPGGRVRFHVIVNRRTLKRVEVEAKVSRVSRVRSSSGLCETRCFVATVMKLGPIWKEIEISLASREPMRFRMLLGRTALSGDVLIDPSKRYSASPRVTKAPQGRKARRREKSE